MGPTNLSQPLLQLSGDDIFGDPRSEPQFFGLPRWATTNNPGRVRFIRELAQEYGHLPEMRWYTARILREHQVAARDYPRMAKVILKHVQSKVYYTQEAGEQLQSPWRTLQHGGDCDDAAIVLYSMAYSVGLPVRLALAGADSSGRPVRWVEGEPFKRANYTHIYALLGWPAGRPRKWAAAEPTMQVPLGYDVTIHGTDFDRHGRPHPRPVHLDADGIAVVPGQFDHAIPHAGGDLAFSGPGLVPAPRTLLKWGVVLGLAYYFYNEARFWKGHYKTRAL